MRTKLKCPLCNGVMETREVEFSLYGENLGRFKADVCISCGEEFFNEEVSAKIDYAAKSKGLYGLEANTKVSELGNNVAIRINKRLAGFLKIKKGEEVRVYPENKKKVVVELMS